MRRGVVYPRGWIIDGGAIAALLAAVAPGYATTRRPGCAGKIPVGENVGDG